MIAIRDHGLQAALCNGSVAIKVKQDASYTAQEITAEICAMRQYHTQSITNALVPNIDLMTYLQSVSTFLHYVYK